MGVSYSLQGHILESCSGTSYSFQGQIQEACNRIEAFHMDCRLVPLIGNYSRAGGLQVGITITDNLLRGLGGIAQ
jgi:hypothetical protein